MFSVSPSPDELTSSLRWFVPKGAVLGADFYSHHFALKEREWVDSAEGNPIKPLRHPQTLLCSATVWDGEWEVLEGLGENSVCGVSKAVLKPEDSGKCTVLYK